MRALPSLLRKTGGKYLARECAPESRAIRPEPYLCEGPDLRSVGLFACLISFNLASRYLRMRLTSWSLLMARRRPPKSPKALIVGKESPVA